MIEKIIHRLLLRRHFWRHATLSEVAELYAARLLRMTAGSLIAVMASVYMYKNGYSVAFILGSYAAYFVFKVIIAYPAALIIARFGPKHGMFYANILTIPSLLIFLLLAEYGVWALVGYMSIQAIATVLYDMAHLVSFSKVKSTERAGRELGFMNIVDKVAKGVSPLIGGVIAWLFGPDVTIWAACVLFLLSAIPLLRTAEPVRLNQKITFSGFPWRQAWRSFLAEAAIGVDNAGSIVIWEMYLIAIILAGAGNVAYAQIGALASVTLIVGLVIPRIYGRIVDKRRGFELLQYGVIANAIVHFIRPIVATPVSAGAANVARESASTAFVISFLRGMFDLADRSGHRIAYLLIIEIALNIGSALMYGLATLLVFYLDDRFGLSLSFIIVGLVSLTIGSARFPLYRR